MNIFYKKAILLIFLLFMVFGNVFARGVKAVTTAARSGNAAVRSSHTVNNVIKASGRYADKLARIGWRASNSAGGAIRVSTLGTDDIARFGARYGNRFTRLGLREGDDIIRNFKHVKQNSRNFPTGIKVRKINSTRDIARNGNPTGGYYGELRQEISKIPNSGGRFEVHHIPSNEAVFGSTRWPNGNVQPAIIMDKADHLRTASNGSSASATAFRRQQQTLIEQGKFLEAFEMDVNNLRSLGLYNKYRPGIDQTRRHIQDLMSQGIINF